MFTIKFCEEPGSQITQISRRNKTDKKIEVYSVTNSEGFTRSVDYFCKEVFSKDTSNYKVVHKGEFAYNPSRINVGSIDYLSNADKALVSPLYIVFASKETLLPGYLLRFLKSDWGNIQIRSHTEGAVRDSLKYKGLEAITIPLPQLDDQIRIATLLSKVENLISRRREQLKQLDELLKSVFLDMFGDPVRNEKGWDILPFHKVGHFVSGGTPSKKRADFWSGNFPWVSPKDMKVSKIKDAEDHIAESVFEETTLKRISLNHLLIVVRGMILLHSFPVAINTVEIAINQDMKAIKPINRLNVVYLQYCVIASKRKILKLITTAGHGTRKFDYNAMQKLYIPMPPIDRQNQFADISEMVEVIKLRYQQSLTELENLYGTLSQKAFKGELDLSRVLQVKEVEPAI